MLVSWVSCLFLVLCQSLDLCLHSIHPHNRRLLSGMTPGRHTLFWLSITFCCQWPGNSRYIREKSKLFVFHDRYSMSQLTEIVACGKYNWDTYAIVNIHNTCFSIIYLYVFICFFKKWPILHPFYHSWCIPRNTSPGSSQPICMSKAKERGSITASSDRKNKPNLRGTVIARAPGEKELAHQLQHPNPQLCSYLFLRVIWDIFRLQLVKGGRGDGQAGRRSFGSGFAACSVTNQIMPTNVVLFVRSYLRAEVVPGGGPFTQPASYQGLLHSIFSIGLCQHTCPSPFLSLRDKVHVPGHSKIATRVECCTGVPEMWKQLCWRFCRCCNG